MSLSQLQVIAQALNCWRSIKWLWRTLEYTKDLLGLHTQRAFNTKVDKGLKMNLRIIQITPLATHLAPSVKRPPNTAEYNYQAVAIENDGKHYYWAKGISLEITPEEHELVLTNPKLFVSSTTHRLHEQLVAIENLDKGRI